MQVRRYRPAQTVDPVVLTELARLARERFTVRFDYSDRKQASTQRRAEPYRIVNAGQRWYLVAWDLDRADWRTFRVDRMRPGISAGMRFTSRPLTDADAEALVARGVPPEARKFQARVVVHLPAERLAERVGPWIGTVETLDDERSILVTGAERIEDIAVHLGMLGADFRVTEPPELVEALRVLARRYVSRRLPEAHQPPAYTAEHEETGRGTAADRC